MNMTKNQDINRMTVVIKVGPHDITEILLKEALKTITLAITIVKSNSVSSVLSMYAMNRFP